MVVVLLPPSACEPAKKRQKELLEEQRKKKQQTDRARRQTQVNIGPAFSEWGEWRQTEACKSDADLAFLLLYLCLWDKLSLIFVFLVIVTSGCIVLSVKVFIMIAVCYGLTSCLAQWT